MVATTLGGVTLTGVDSIRVNKNANVIPLPMPTEDSDKTEVFDMLGVVKMIGVTGMFAGDTATTKAKIDSIEALITGNQLPISFISDATGTISCMVASIDTTWNLPGNNCNYNIKLIQGVQL